MFDALRRPNDGFASGYDRLAQVGLVVGDGGKLNFDAERFREAYADDPDAVEELFTRRDVRPVDNGPDENGVVVNDPDRPIEFDALGVLGQLEQLADSYVSSIGGILQNRNTA